MSLPVNEKYIGETHLRLELPLDNDVVQAPVATSSLTMNDRAVLLGSWLSGLALAWIVNERLMPWSGAIAFLLSWFVLGLLVLTLTSALTTSKVSVVDRVMASVVYAGALIVGAALVSVVLYIFIKGSHGLPHFNMWFDDMKGVGPRDPLDKGGVMHAVVGTLIEIAIAVCITIPLGIGTAVYMTEIGGKFAVVVRTVVEAMTALPSIVAGLFIYTVLLIELGFHRNGFAASLALSVMMLPIIARAADVVLRVVPSGLREASLALGSSRWKTVWHVVLPTARPGLATAVILGVARGIGETSPVLLTSGAATFLVTNPTGGVMNSLPLFIFSTVRSGEPLYVDRAFAAASILLILVLVLFVSARLLARPPRTRARRTPFRSKESV